MIIAIAVVSGALMAGCQEGGAGSDQSGKRSRKEYDVQKTDAEWREELTDEQYHVMRKQGTERAFTGKYWDTKKAGTYACAGCGQPLFKSEQKFNSGTGWPSFWAPADQEAVDTQEDRSWFGVRTEVHCSKCGGHLGHVFDDGPEPTGLRYCVNSASLELVEADEGPPAQDDQ